MEFFLYCPGIATARLQLHQLHYCCLWGRRRRYYFYLSEKNASFLSTSRDIFRMNLVKWKFKFWKGGVLWFRPSDQTFYLNVCSSPCLMIRVGIVTSWDRRLLCFLEKAPSGVFSQMAFCSQLNSFVLHMEFIAHNILSSENPSSWIYVQHQAGGIITGLDINQRKEIRGKGCEIKKAKAT